MGDEKQSNLEKLLSSDKFSPHLIYTLIVVSLSVGLPIYHLYTAYFGQPQAEAHRSLFLSTIMVLVFLTRPIKREGYHGRFNPFFAIDILLTLLTVFCEIYLIHDIDAVILRWGEATVLDAYVGSIYIALVLEASRRAVGLPMALIAAFFIVQTLWAEHFFSIFQGPSMPWKMFVDFMFLQEVGIFGIPIMVMSSVIILFLIFGSMLLKSGAGSFFTDLALSITGRRVGGPAKASAISSALFGTVSGSAVANVMVDGWLTIPLMRKAGFRNETAASIEAIASSGGQIMPPVMGAAAFIIAQFLGISYFQVCLSAAIPAILYYASLYIMVHMEARKFGLEPLRKGEMPKLLKVLKENGHLLLALAALILFLTAGYTAMMAAFWAIITVFFLSFLRKGTRLNATKFLAALEDSADSALMVAMACACAGIIIGCLYLSGLGDRFSFIFVEAGGGRLWLTLFLCMIASIILGMGMPVTAVYLTLSSVAIPALIKMGVVPIAAHLFCFYYGVISNITPPVALAVFAAAGIAGSNPFKTGLTATKLGITSFIIPFVIVYRPSLVWVGSIENIIWSCIACVVGVFCLAVAVQGWLFRKVGVVIRILLFGAAIGLIKPGIYSDIIGFGILIAAIIYQKFSGVINTGEKSAHEPIRGENIE